MADAANTTGPTVEHQGFLLWSEWHECTATSRIKRPDGTWRESQPTDFGAIVVWKARRIDEEAGQERCFGNREEACRWIDEQAAKYRLRMMGEA